MEAEVRFILSDTVRPKNIGMALFEASREEPADLPVPPRNDEARTEGFQGLSSIRTSFQRP